MGGKLCLLTVHPIEKLNKIKFVNVIKLDEARRRLITPRDSVAVLFQSLSQVRLSLVTSFDLSLSARSQSYTAKGAGKVAK